MRKNSIALTVLLLANSMLGMGGIEFLKTLDGVDVVSVTSTGLVVKHRPTRIQKGWKDGRYFERPEPYEEELTLTPDQQTLISGGGRDGPQVMLTPVAFKSQHKGFRVTEAYSSSPAITYIVLSDTPMELGEDDVEMVMDDGEWVRAEDSRSLEIEKLGWSAKNMIGLADATMRIPEWKTNLLSNPEGVELWNLLVDKGLIKYPKLEALRVEDRVISPRLKRLLAWDWEHGLISSNLMAHILRDPELARVWHAAVEEGLIKTNIKPKLVTVFEGAGGMTASPPIHEENETSLPVVGVERNKPSLWLYAAISLCVLLPILYFLRRKLTNH